MTKDIPIQPVFKVVPLDKIKIKKKPEVNLSAEWEQLLQFGYDAPYVTKDGVKIDHIDFNAPLCPHAYTMPGCNLIRRCNKVSHHVEVFVGSDVMQKNVGYPCPPRGWALHWKSCPW